jgi:phosphoglycerate dehydrogenase-like enzyme
MHRIAVLDDYQNVSQRFGDWAAVRLQAEVAVFTDHLRDEEALVRRLQPFDVLCVMRERTRFPRGVLQRLPNLRLIASTGNWNAAIDIDAAAELGITVCGTGSSPTAAAELTWTLLLAAARQLPVEVGAFRGGQWQVTVGSDLHGKTLGVLGLGHSGSMVARYGQAFGMRVLAWSQNMTPALAREQGAEYVTLDALVAASDFISIHVRLSDRTRSLVGADQLARMKPTCWLINTARGPIVDEAALLHALRERRIAGAALDVFEPEPLPAGHPLRGLDNVIGTCHVGYVTDGSYAIYYGESVENILAWISGRPIRTLTPESREVAYVSDQNEPTGDRP